MQFAILNFQIIIVGLYAADLSKFLSSLFKQDEDPEIQYTSLLLVQVLLVKVIFTQILALIRQP